jgi:hypothetical protein
MARISQFYTDPNDAEGIWDYLNVSAVVGGQDGVNHPDDVMLVQALLRYLPANVRGVADRECPLPNGTFDKATARAIRKYQEVTNKNYEGRSRLIPDGRVSPGQGKLLFGRGAYIWTIITLNLDAEKFARTRGFTKECAYMDDIFQLWPQVKSAIYREEY